MVSGVRVYVASAKFPHYRITEQSFDSYPNLSEVLAIMRIVASERAAQFTEPITGDQDRDRG